jgi:dihydrofolate reductase
VFEHQVARELKQQGGLGIWLCGGGHLAGTRWPEIDRPVVKINRVVLGTGINLFAGARFEPRSIRLTDHQIYQSGVAVLTYRKA